MTDPKRFLTTPRRDAPKRPVDVRIRDWGEVVLPLAAAEVQAQAGRCMDCGVPFCHSACPLGNRIPAWNDLVDAGDWHRASEQLHATNNFPEFTGKLCPAPCEAACVLALDSAPVTIKTVEASIAERAWAEGWVLPRPAARQSGRSVAVVGSGPSGLAAAQQLTRAGHAVTVLERDDRLGGLLRYGIPDYKMDKGDLDRRLGQMRAEGTTFRTGVEAGADIDAGDLRASFDAVLLATGATVPRDLPIPGRELAGVHFAMDYLSLANRVQAGDLDAPPIDARGRHVVIVGGGDTGADCYGTAVRQGAASVTQLMIHPRPPLEPDASTPWPTWPLVLRTSPAHEEGGERLFAVMTERFLPGHDGRVGALELSEVRRSGGGWQRVPGGDRRLRCDLVLLAVGFSGPDRGPLVGLGVELAERGTIGCGPTWETSAPGVFVAGDAVRGASLIVWAVADGRAAAAAIHQRLGGARPLPAPVTPASRPLV